MTRDQLDQAIDHVAARLTHVTHDEALARRIIETLPERSGWSLHWLMPRLAITAVLAIGVSLVVLRMFDERSTNVQTGVQTNVQTNVQTDVPTHALSNDRLNARPNGRMNDRLNVRLNVRLNDRLEVPDFDRSLEALDALGALSLASVAPSVLLEDALLTLPQLAIEELPLTAETISPR